MSLPDHKRAQWAQHIQAWRESGSSQQAYCQQHDLKPPQFWYWKRKLEKVDPAAALHADKARSSTRRFLPVNVVPDRCVESLSVVLPNGLQITGITQHNVVIAGQLAEALK